MTLLYMVETAIVGSCGTKRAGLPTFNLEKAKENARDASILNGRAYVFGLDGYTCAVFEGGNELAPEQW